MKRVLFLTPFVPSRHGAAENFTRLLLEDYNKLGYSVDLIYFKYKGDESYLSQSKSINVLKVVENSKWIKIKNIICFPFFFPLFTVRFDWKLLKYLKKIIRNTKYDYIYLDHSQMFLYGHFLKENKIVMRSHDIIIQRYERQSNSLINWFVEKSEKFALNIKSSILFTPSQKDCDIIENRYGVKSYVSKEYLSDSVIEATPQCIKKQLTLMGKWSRPDNSDGLLFFIQNVLPSINDEIQIKIIGSGMPQHIIDLICNYHQIEYMGFVYNPYPLIANSKALISPLFTGAGVKVKVVEALACGTPVIGSEISFEGIDGACTDFMFIAETAEDYVKKIQDVCNININNRIEYKNKFLSSYGQETIPTSVERLWKKY